MSKTLPERLREEAKLIQYGERACVPGLLHEAADELGRLEATAAVNHVSITENQRERASAIECLRDIAAMGKKAGSETAHHWLLQHGYPLEAGGYVPGAQGFGDSR